jgi:hypothetical protein
MSEYGKLLEDLKKKDHEAAIIQQRIKDKILSLADGFEEDLVGMSVSKLQALLEAKQDEYSALQEKAHSIEAKARASLEKLSEEIDDAKDLL